MVVVSDGGLGLVVWVGLEWDSAGGVNECAYAETGAYAQKANFFSTKGSCVRAHMSVRMHRGKKGWVESAQVKKGNGEPSPKKPNQPKPIKEKEYFRRAKTKGERGIRTLDSSQRGGNRREERRKRRTEGKGEGTEEEERKEDRYTVLLPAPVAVAVARARGQRENARKGEDKREEEESSCVKDSAAIPSPRNCCCHPVTIVVAAGSIKFEQRRRNRE
ncbi:uncharacterized protein DS421_15g502460 [Arachis hypogaea]|nr:uncharacterized protein DS421_15g502460 [Arachis hypogaea]